MFSWLLAVLATYRLSRMVVAEDGPFDVFTHFRTWVFGHTSPNGWVQRGLACVYCVSFWLSWPVTLLLKPADGWQWTLYSLGAAGAVVLLYEMLLTDTAGFLVRAARGIAQGLAARFPTRRVTYTGKGND